jgi:hypothetical protein
VIKPDVAVHGGDTVENLRLSLELMGDCIVEVLVAAEQYMPPDKFRELRKVLENKGFEFFAVPVGAEGQQTPETPQ